MARTRIQEFPFVAGQNESADAKLLPDGLLTRAKNVRLRKDGRFGVRADFDAVSNNTINSANLIPYDLIGFDESLLAIGDGNGFSSDTTPWDIAELVSTTPGTWRLTSQAGTEQKLSTCVNMREIPALPSSAGPALNIDSVNRVDCAASGGFVCVALQSGTARVIFHILRASTGATIFSHSRQGIRPRVVAVGSVFFLLSLDTGGTTLRLDSFDPSAHTAAQTHTDLSTGTAVACYDAVTDLAGTGFWVAVNLSTPTTSLIPVNSSGVAGTPITGPAVAYQHVAVCQTTSRVHLLSIIAGGALELRSYTTGGALSTGPTTVEATAADRQPGLSNATFAGTEGVEVVYERTDTATFAFVGTAGWQKINALTHALVAVGNSNISSVRNGYLGSKPAVGGAINFHHVFAFLRPDGDFLSHGLRAADDNSDDVLYAYKDRFAAVASNADTTPQIALDSSTGKFYWPNLYLGADGNSWPRLTEFQFAGSARRQAAAIGGILYIGGAVIQTFDGRTLAENYFFDKPQILTAVASNGAGSLPTNTSLLVAVVFEWIDRKGNLRQSDISTVETVTMGATDDTITLTVTRGLGNRCAESPVTVVAYRSTSGVNQLRRAESTIYAFAGSGVTLTLLASDATVRANGVIYTQAGRGALSGTTPHEPAFPADYLWKFGARLLAANADQAFVSRELFPGEAISWSQEVGFTIPKISERIRAVAALDVRGLIFTAESIYAFAGDGPNDLGEGRYGEPVKLPSSVGIEDWRSLVETPIGLFFQGSNGQLWVLPRDGSAPDWIGQPVRDTLVSFPVVTSATLVTEEQLVCFTCNNTGLTDARIVCYDLRAKTWIVDEFASSTPIKAACSYQGRLAILSSGVVYTEKTSLTPGTFIEHGLTTGTIKPFDWGKVCRFGLIGEYRGDCDIYARISHDDGKTFTTMSKIQQLRSATYAVGDTVDVEWTPSRWKTDGFRLDFSARTPGSATEGFVFNSYWIEYMTERRGARRASTLRG